MSRPSRYLAELRQRAVRMVAEVRPNYDSDWAAITAVAQKLGIGTTDSFDRGVSLSEPHRGARARPTDHMSWPLWCRRLDAAPRRAAEAQRRNVTLAASTLRGRRT